MAASLRARAILEGCWQVGANMQGNPSSTSHTHYRCQVQQARFCLLLFSSDLSCIVFE